jgi:hypothetical protein
MESASFSASARMGGFLKGVDGTVSWARYI